MIRATFDFYASANTTAVFQVESSGMKDMLKQAKPIVLRILLH